METLQPDERNFKEKNRVSEIDFLRGLAILFVIFDHLFFDLYVFSQTALQSGAADADGFLYALFAFADGYFDSTARFIAREVFVSLFFLVCGVSTAFSKNNLKRGLKLLAIALTLTVVSHIISTVSGYDMFIDFSVIHCFAVSILLYEALKKLSPKSFVALGLLAIALHVAVQYVPFEPKTKLLIWLGIKPYYFTYLDYNALIPYIGFFFFGAAIAKRFYAERKTLVKSDLFARAPFRPINFLGRHTLVIYFGEQVVVPLVLLLLALIFHYV